MVKKQYTRYNYLGNITNQQSNFCLGIQQSSCAGSQPFSYTQLPISHPHRQSSLTHIYLLVLVICQSPSTQFFDIIIWREWSISVWEFSSDPVHSHLWYTQLPISHPHSQSSLTHIYLLVLVICQSPSAQFFDTSLFDGNGHFPISKWPVEGRYKNCTKATDTCKDFNYRDILLIKKEFFYNYFFSMDPVFYSILWVQWHPAQWYDRMFYPQVTWYKGTGKQPQVIW